MAQRSTWNRIRRIWAITGIAVTVAFVTWCVLAYRATPEARAAAITNGRVEVVSENGVVRYISTAMRDVVPVGLVFFPGSLVEPEAYAPLCRALAEAGFPVIMVPLPRRGALGGADNPSVLSNALSAMHDDDRAEKWVLAGHSRGAVVAIKMAHNLAVMGAGSVAGLVLVGTTHPRDVDLSGYRLPVTKIVGTNDGIASAAKSDANRHLLPPSVRWVSIAGGNHSQFGWYGFQPLDHFASISRADQQQQTIAAIIDALRAAGQTQQPSALNRQ